MSVEVIFAYEATDSSQLSLRVGERITVIQRKDGGWWIGSNEEGKMGIFPASYTKVVKEKPKFNVPKEFKTAMLAGSSSSTDAGGGLHPQVSPTTSQPSGGGAAAVAEHVKRQQLSEQLGFGGDNGSAAQRAATAPTLTASIDKVVAIMREVRLLKRDVAALESRKQARADAQQAQQADIDALHLEVMVAKSSIRRKSRSVANREMELEVLRCALEGLPLPAYDPVLEEDTEDITNAASPPPSGATDAVQTCDDDGHRSDGPPEKREATFFFTIDDPPPDDVLNGDQLARKVVKKLRKRLGEADTTAAEYTKQAEKLKRRIAKHEAALQKLDVEGEGSNTSPLSPTASLPPEVQEQVAADRAQLAKLQGKIARLQSALQDSDIASQMEKELKKLEKRLAKGNEANKALEETCKQLAADTAAVKQRSEEAAQRLGVSSAQLAAAKAKAAEAEKAASKDVKDKEEEVRQLRRRLEAELKRVADFDSQLAGLLAAAEKAT